MKHTCGLAHKFPGIHWPCFSLLMKQKLGSLHCLTNPSKCLIAAFFLVLISKRMELAGLSEVINIRGHKAMLIEWSPHCHAQGVSLLTPFLSQSFSFHSDSPTPFSLVCLSYKSLGDPPLLELAFPTDSSKKTGLVWSGWRSCWESLAPVWIQVWGVVVGWEGGGLNRGKGRNWRKWYKHCEKINSDMNMHPWMLFGLCQTCKRFSRQWLETAAAHTGLVLNFTFYFEDLWVYRLKKLIMWGITLWLCWNSWGYQLFWVFFLCSGPLLRPTLWILRDKPGQWQSTLAKTKGHWFHIQLCRWNELGLHHVPGCDGTSVTHIEANIVGGCFFYRHHLTNLWRITSTLNPNQWWCSCLDHRFHCIWRKSPLQLFPPGYHGRGMSYGKGSMSLPDQGWHSPATTPQSRTTVTAPPATERKPHSRETVTATLQADHNMLPTIDFLLCVPIFTWKCNKTVIIPTLRIFLPDKPSQPITTHPHTPQAAAAQAAIWRGADHRLSAPGSSHSWHSGTDRESEGEWGERQRWKRGGWKKRCTLADR